jgi:hypothetical protein
MTRVVPVSTSFSMPKWLRDLKEKMESVEKNTTGPIKVAKIHELPSNFFQFLSENEGKKIRVYGSDIFVVGNESNVHRSAVQYIGGDIGGSKYCQNRNLTHFDKPHFVVVNKFRCGCLVKKIPDGLFGNYNSGTPIVSFEIAFRHEDIDLLYWESVHSLTEFTTIELSIVMITFVHVENDRFDALFFAMRRTAANPPGSRLNPLGKPFEAKQRFETIGPVEGYYCTKEREDVPEDFPPERFPAGNLQEQQRLGVEVFFERIINEENYEQDFTIPMRSSADNILIRGHSMALVRANYKAWWQRRFHRN